MLGSTHQAIVHMAGVRLIIDKTYVGVVHILQLVIFVQIDIVSFIKANTATWNQMLA
jgi:hypothetical protein